MSKLFYVHLFNALLVRKGLVSIFVTATSLIGLSTQPAFALEQADPEIIEEVVTIGTRGKPRSVAQSLAPVDVISGDDFTNQGGIDTSDLLRNIVPSFNVNDQPISDAATLVRPANLRGLAPDHTLVLVNGQRRHRAGVITWLGNGVATGSQGPDIAAIPSLALRSVEVLRDGAAAQYGSDAIAGVLNFNLKNDDSGGSFEAKYGGYQEGDGDQYSFAVNKGLPWGETGFINFTAEWADTEATDRAVQRSDAAALIAAGFQEVGNPAQVWGTPEVTDDYKIWVNFGKEITEGIFGDDISTDIELFGTANYNKKDVLGGFYYRNPTNRGGVYARTNDGGTPGSTNALKADDFNELLVASSNGADCSQYVVNSDRGTDASSAALTTALAGLLADDNCFNFSETIPGGFTPNFGGEITDASFLIGLRGALENGIDWSVSAYWGNNEADFVINNTINASLGAETPRDFDPGSYEQEDVNFNADFSYEFSTELQLSFGAEYRKEEFTIGAGQTESYIDGGLGSQGFSTSTNGFPGFSPQISGSFDRTNYALYVDVEYLPTENLLLGGAVRYEDFDDFGTTTNYKFGANYSWEEGAGLRATISTGFKAPTPGQSNASNISTQIVNGVLTNQGVIPSTSPAARLQGGSELQPEESTNYTFGAYLSVGTFDLTADYFYINVEDRLNLSNDFVLTQTDLTTLSNQGIDASDISEFRFFTNQFETDTSGVDVVISTDTDWLSGVTNWQLAFNITTTDVVSRDPTLFNVDRVRLIQNGTPGTRWNFTANHNINQWRFLARLNYYGDFYDNEASGYFDDAILLDLKAAYTHNEEMTFTLGARNVSNEQGCSTSSCGTTPPSALGLPYSQFSPFGFNGAFYYGRFSYILD